MAHETTTLRKSSAFRVLATPRIADTAATFNGIYMRPNVANGGAIPATGVLCTSPDIWPNNTTPLPNYVTALAKTDSYNSDSPAQITLNTTNYIYIRGYNGSQSASTVSVTLYYVPNAIIQWPAQWQNNIIPTDQNKQSGSITNLAPSTIGVAPFTFVWEYVQTPPGGSDHYCLICQFNDANNDNPFPDITSQLDLSALITNNLQWGWHNVSLMTVSGLVTSYVTGLNIASNMSAGTYAIGVTPTGYIGWQIGFQCSEPDSKGNPIVLAPTTISQDNFTILVNAYLEPGYNGVVTVCLYNPNNVANVPPSSAPISCNYVTHSKADFEEGLRRGTINWGATKIYNEQFTAAGMPIGTLHILGTTTGVPPQQ
jgi:hypothetical protein